MHRVDAARNLARVPGRAAEATGRLFVAKRCHEAAKAGGFDAQVLAAVLQDVLASLDAAAHAGAQAEAAEIEQALPP